MSGIMNILSSLVKPITGVINKRTERKQAKESGQAKLAIAKQDSVDKVELSIAEWEAASLSSGDGSWKDEYVTIIVTLWMPTLLIGTIYAAFSGNMAIVVGVTDFLKQVKEAGIDLGEITYIVVLAAVGIKAIKKF